MTTETETAAPLAPPNALAAIFGRSIPPKLAAALVKAQTAAKGVAKDGRNKHSGYDYTTADTMVDAAKAALNGAGLALLPLNLDVGMFTAGPKEVLNFDLLRELALVHESGASVVFSVKWPLYLQSGKRARDKAVGAADTTMMGYVYRDLCAIPRGLDAGSVDDRDDSGTQEPGQTAPPPKASGKPASTKPSGKPAAKSKPAAKPSDAKAKAAKDKAAKAKAAKEKAAAAKAAKVKAAKEKAAAAKKAAADAEAEATAAEADDTVEPTPEDAAEGELAKPGKTSIGQVYGDKAGEVAAEQFAALSEEEQNEQIAAALRQGLTPTTSEGKLLPQLIAMLPPDPKADDLEGAGWERDISEELSDLDDAAPVARKTVNAVTRLATTKLGLKAKDAKTRFIAAFEFMGVDVAAKQPPNGYQLRCFALAVVSAEGELPF